jgi:hypothetical protein
VSREGQGGRSGGGQIFSRQNRDVIKRENVTFSVSVFFASPISALLVECWQQRDSGRYSESIYIHVIVNISDM